MYRTRYPVLRRACTRLLAARDEGLEAFCREQADWLEDYALFMALKGKHGGVPGLSGRRENACAGRKLWRPPGRSWEKRLHSGRGCSTCSSGSGSG